MVDNGYSQLSVRLYDERLLYRSAACSNTVSTIGKLRSLSYGNCAADLPQYLVFYCIRFLFKMTVLPRVKSLQSHEMHRKAYFIKLCLY